MSCIACRENQKQYRPKPGKQRPRHPNAKQYQANYRARRRAELFAAYGGVCACCGESDEAFLTVDHIGGGGTKHRRELREGGGNFYIWLKNQGYPQDLYRLLCMNCNFATRYQQPCPHEQPIHLRLAS